MKKIILIALLAITVQSCAEQKYVSDSFPAFEKRETKVLFADESTYTEMSDNRLKVVSANDTVVGMIISSFEDCIITYCVKRKFCKTHKKYYREYTIMMVPGQKQALQQLFKD